MPYPGNNHITYGGKIKQDTTGPVTEKLLIIGTSVDGPINQPVRVTNTTEAERLFGPATYSNGYKNPVNSTADDSNNGATIPRAIAQAIAAGATNIYVCRATGTFATSPSAFSSKLDITSIYPGRIYNEVSLGLHASGGYVNVVVTQPSIKGQTYVTQYSSSLTWGDMIDRVNGDRRNLTFEINKETYASFLASGCYSVAPTALTTVTLAGGTNGTSAPSEDYATSLDGYATKLTTADTGTFDTLLGMREKFDVAVLTGIHIDDQIVTSGAANPAGGTYTAADEYERTIATDFVLFLDAVSTEISPCFGVIGCRPPGIRSTTKLIDYINNALLSTTSGKYNASMKWNKAGYFLYTGWYLSDPVAGQLDLGQRLAVVAGPEVVYSHPKLGNYTDQFHVSYAAMLTTIAPERAAVFKPLPGVIAYGTPIPAKYCNKLVEGVGFSASADLSGQGAYVCLTRDPRNPQGPLVVFDDVTAAARDDYMRNHQLVHLCNSIHNNLQLGLNGFIGGPTSPAALAAMETVVQNIMDGYVQSSALRGARGSGYDFSIRMSGADQALGIIRVNLEIAPATSLRKIYFVVAVRQSS